MYAIDELLDERNRELYQVVAAARAIELKPVDGTRWSERSDATKVTIFVGKSPDPPAYFAHELLHAKYELEGMREPAARGGEHYLDVVHWLYETFTHMRMFDDFVAMGYSPVHFLADADTNEIRNTVGGHIKTIERLHAKKQYIAPLVYAMPYLMMRVPPPLPEFSKWSKKLDKMIPSKTRDNLEMLVQAWIEGGQYDVATPIAHFLKVVGLQK